ncbi:DNA helicase [Tanacetum coccineum]
MWLARPNMRADERNLNNSFASWLFDVCDGKTGQPDQQDPENTSWIDISLKYCLLDKEEGLLNLINFIYDQNTLRTPSAVSVQQKAIFCPKNQTTGKINLKLLNMVQDESTTYLSHHKATPAEHAGTETKMLYPVEDVNILTLAGFPLPRLELTVGAPMMLLRTVNHAGRLCNSMMIIVRISFTYRSSLGPDSGSVFFKFTTLMELSMIAQLTPGSYNKTIKAKVYRKWIGKSLPDLTPSAFCCILLDRERNAIQANMSLKDLDYFNPKLQIGMAYRISNFICEPTSPYQQTLENKTSLRFGKYTTFDNIPATTFPHHFFQFTSYNQLELKMPKPDKNMKMQYPGNVLLRVYVSLNR